MSLALDDEVGFDEPGDEAPAVTAAKDRNVLAISQDMDRVKNALNEFDRVSAGLAAIEANYPKDAIYEVTTTKGFKDAVEHRAAWRDPRIMVEKARKMAKAPLLALGKSIDARASWLTEKLLEGEQPIDQLIKAEEARREEEKQARINAEAGRILRIQEALAEIGQDVLVACGKSSDEIRALSELMHATQPDRDVFQEMHDQAKAAWVAGIAKLETTLKAKLWDEEQQARAEAERLAEIARQAQEKARLESVRIENERVATEQKAERERMATERAEFERQQAEFRAQQEAAAQVERDKLAAVALAEQQKQDAAALEARQREEEAAAIERQRLEQLQRDADAAAALLEAAAQPAPIVNKPAITIDLAAPEPFVPVIEEAATLQLGELCKSIDADGGLKFTAAFLADSGYPATEGKHGAKLYKESERNAILDAISARVLSAKREEVAA